MSVPLIIFDCDGTLVDTETLYLSTVADMLAENGYKEYSFEECGHKFTGMTFTDMRLAIEAEQGREMPFMSGKEYVARAQAQMEQGIESIPGASELLEFCASHHKICVASNGERSSVIKSLKLTGLYDRFEGGEDHIFTKIQVEKGKPAPDLFLFAAEKMGCESSPALVVEDSVPGIRAAVAAGMEAYGFTGSHHDPVAHAKTLKNAGASKVYDSLIHMAEELKNQNNFSDPLSRAS